MKATLRTTSEYVSRSRLIVFFVLCMVVSARCQEYSVNGEMEISIRSGAGDVGQNTTFAFSVAVKVKNYKIRVWLPGRENDYQEYACDGTNMYILHHFTTSKSLPGFSLTNTPLMYPASVEERSVPRNDGWGAQFIWFAYASQDYVCQLTNDYNVMLPIWSPEDPQLRKQPFDMPVFFSCLQPPSKLPATASFVNDGYYRSYDPALKRFDIIKLKPPFDKGFTNAYYNTLTVTNANSYTIPGGWSFVVFSTPFDNELPFERQMIRGHTTGISNSAQGASALPEFAGIAAVADYRVHGSVTYHGTNVSYAYAPVPITNGQWIAPTQLELLRKKIESRVESQIRSREVQQPRKVGGQIIQRKIILEVPPAGWTGAGEVYVG
jgi:hypothetical protein